MLSSVSFPNEAAAVEGTAGALAIADLNGDRKPDVVTITGGLSRVSVLIGKGDGTFRPKQGYDGGYAAGSVAVGDLNGDKRPDIVTTNGWYASLTILYGRGDGTFRQGVQQEIRNRAREVTIADVNGDHINDIITANQDPSPKSSCINVMLGKLDGSFQAAKHFTISRQPTSIAAADVNGDGRVDVVTTSDWSTGSVNVLLGNGDGAFQRRQTCAMASGAYSVVIADLNADRRVDLVTANSRYKDSRNVSVFLGKGDGTFKAERTFDAGGQASAVAVGDVNGDGKPDLVTANDYSRTVSLLSGNGDGTFQKPQTFAAGDSSIAVAISDLNRDGSPEILSTGGYAQNASIICVLRNQGGGKFAVPPSLSMGAWHPTDIVAADLNEDGYADIATANDVAPGTVSVQLGIFDGFQWGGFISVADNPNTISAADFDGDHHLDLMTANLVGQGATAPGAIDILHGNGDGTFSALNRITMSDLLASVTPADVNGDSIPDLLLGKFGEDNVDMLEVWLGDGKGGFSEQQRCPVDGVALSIAAGDVDGDGKVDVVSGDYGSASLLPGNGDGTFHPYRSFAVDSGVGHVVLADLNHDQRLDMIVSGQSDAAVGVLIGNGDGTFQEPSMYAVGDAPGRAAVADMNGDHILDLVVPNGSGSFSVLLGKGDGTFQSQQIFFVGGFTTSVAVLDVNFDDLPDLVLPRSDSYTVALLRNDSFRARIVENSILTVQGTSGDDVISVRRSGAKIVVSCGDNSFSCRAAGITNIQIAAGAGNDRVTIGAGVTFAGIQGEDGNDTLVGTDGDNSMVGGRGNDVLIGGSGNNYLLGGDGDDSIYGGAGNDALMGNAGNDEIDGGPGRDQIVGNDGNDVFTCIDLLKETIDGGAGHDTAYADTQDVLTSIESRR
jgi:hypothetical protein